jgi:hypothetical protein
VFEPGQCAVYAAGNLNFKDMAQPWSGGTIPPDDIVMVKFGLGVTAEHPADVDQHRLRLTVCEDAVFPLDPV